MSWLNQANPPIECDEDDCPDCPDCPPGGDFAPWTVDQLAADGWTAVEFDLDGNVGDYQIPSNFDVAGSLSCLFVTTLSTVNGILLPALEDLPGPDLQVFLVVPDPALDPSTAPIFVSTATATLLSTGGNSIAIDTVRAVQFVPDGDHWRVTQISPYLV